MTDSTDNAPKRITHPHKGPDLPTEVFADPGRHDWYFREKMPDSVARFVRADLAPDPLDDPRVVALVDAVALAIHRGVIWRDETEREFQMPMMCYEALVDALAAFDTGKQT